MQRVEPEFVTPGVLLAWWLLTQHILEPLSLFPLFETASLLFTEASAALRTFLLCRHIVIIFQFLISEKTNRTFLAVFPANLRQSPLASTDRGSFELSASLKASAQPCDVVPRVSPGPLEQCSFAIAPCRSCRFPTQRFESSVHVRRPLVLLLRSPCTICRCCCCRRSRKKSCLVSSFVLSSLGLSAVMSISRSQCCEEDRDTPRGFLHQLPSH